MTKTGLKNNYILLIIIMISILGLIYIIRLNSNYPQCIRYEEVKKKVTYYDFTESGTGITEGLETRHICTQWEQKKEESH